MSFSALSLLLYLAASLTFVLSSIVDNSIDLNQPSVADGDSPSSNNASHIFAELKKQVVADHDIAGQIVFDKFQKFVRIYDKTYGSVKEARLRFDNFCDSLKRIDKLRDQEKGTAIYSPNQFSDLSAEEFRKYFLSPRPWNLNKKPSRKATLTDAQLRDVPKSWDWREEGAVTPVKNQGYCGSCWAFSTTGNIEGQWQRRTGKLVSLSEQELVDCDKVDQGCNGGLPSDAYKEIMRIGGLETETDYPYDGRDEKCHFNKTEIKVFINDSLQLPKNETELAAWLHHNGPISIGINANAMQFYFGGVSHPYSFLCSPTSLDHGVLIVGYGVEQSFLRGPIPYWIIKNSWGASWGEKGYYRIYRGDGSCGVNQMCTSAVIN